MTRKNVADYLRMLQNLLPLGMAWTRRPDATLTKTLTASVEELSRVDDAAWRALDETNPLYAVELLPEWEAIAGLPDECSALSDTIEERRNAVIQKLRRPVGQNAAFFRMLAESLGYESPEVEEFPLFRVEKSRVGDALNDAPGGGVWDTEADPPVYVENLYFGWRYVWLLRMAEVMVVPFRAGSQVGDRLRKWGDGKLECVVMRAKPAHTHVLFAYGTVINNKDKECKLCREWMGRER